MWESLEVTSVGNGYSCQLKPDMVWKLKHEQVYHSAGYEFMTSPKIGLRKITKSRKIAIYETEYLARQAEIYNILFNYCPRDEENLATTLLPQCKNYLIVLPENQASMGKGITYSMVCRVGNKKKIDERPTCIRLFNPDGGDLEDPVCVSFSS